MEAVCAGEGGRGHAPPSRCLFLFQDGEFGAGIVAPVALLEERWNIVEFRGGAGAPGRRSFVFWRKTWCPPSEGGGAALSRPGGAPWRGAPAKLRGEHEELCPLGCEAIFTQRICSRPGPAGQVRAYALAEHASRAWMRGALSQGRSATGFGRVVVGWCRTDGLSRWSKVVFFGRYADLKRVWKSVGAGRVCRAQDSGQKQQSTGIPCRVVVVYGGAFPWAFVGSSVAYINQQDPHSIRWSCLGSTPLDSHDSRCVPDAVAHRYDRNASPTVGMIEDPRGNTRSGSPSLDGVGKEPCFSTRSSS